MYWTRRSESILLLAAFLIGGVLAPVVHRVQHSLQSNPGRIDEARSACYSDTSHPIDFAISILGDDQNGTTTCLLCSAILYYTLSDELFVSPGELVPAIVHFISNRPHNISHYFSVIRAPPMHA